MKTWKEFFDNRSNDDTDNPFWRDINADHSFANLPTDDFDTLVTALNGRKLTNYLNRQVETPSDWESHFGADETKAREEATYAISALDAMKLKDRYLKHMDDYGWRPQLVNARHYFYLTYLISKFPRLTQKPLRILEIGGGSGTLSLFLRAHADVVEYVDVDFPEMCLVNYCEHQRYAERKNVDLTYAFFNSGDQGTLPKGGGGPKNRILCRASLFFCQQTAVWTLRPCDQHTLASGNGP